MAENAALRQQRSCVMLHIKGHNRLSAEPEPNGPFESTVLARPLPVTKPYRTHPRSSANCNWLCECANLTIPRVRDVPPPTEEGWWCLNHQSMCTSRSFRTEPLKRRLINKSASAPTFPLEPHSFTLLAPLLALLLWCHAQHRR